MIAIEYGWEIVLIAILLCAYWQEMTTHDPRWTAVLRGVVLALCAGFGSGLLQATYGKMITLRIDPALYRIDEAMGAPTLTMARYVHTHLLLAYTVWFVYSMLLIASLATFIAYVFLVGIRDANRVLIAFVMNAALAVPVYMAFPACGPGHVFAGFPVIEPHITSAALHLTDVPNCLPSVHMSTALLIFWYASRWRIGAVLAGVHIASTVISTIGLGEHYMIDLILAVPYTALIIYINSPAKAREETVCTTTRLIEPSIS